MFPKKNRSCSRCPGTVPLLPARPARGASRRCVEVEAAYYGLPPGWIGRLVQVQWDELYVRILDPNNGLLLREHVRQKRGWYRIKKKTTRNTDRCASLSYCGAGRAGTHIGTLCTLFIPTRRTGCPPCLRHPRAGQKFGLAAVEEACATALEMGVYEYRFVRRYLERGPQLTYGKSIPSFASWCNIAISSTSEPRSQKMNSLS